MTENYEIITNEVEFDQELYEQNLKENQFPENDELDGIGVDKEGE